MQAKKERFSIPSLQRSLEQIIQCGNGRAVNQGNHLLQHRITLSSCQSTLSYIQNQDAKASCCNQAKPLSPTESKLNIPFYAIIPLFIT